MAHIKVIMVMRLQEGKGSFQVILDKEIRKTTSKTFGSTQRFHSDTPKICVCLILFFKLPLKSLNTTCYFFKLSQYHGSVLCYFSIVCWPPEGF